MFEALQTSKILFGSRLVSSFSASSRKSEFLAELSRDYPGVRIPSTTFRTDTGSRYSVASSNSMSLLLFETTIKKVVERYKNEKYSGRLLRVMENANFPVTRILCGQISLIFIGLIEPFIKFSSGSKEHGLYSYGDLLKTHQTLESQLLKIKRSRQPFRDLLVLTKNEVSKENEGFYLKIKTLFDSADQRTINIVNSELLANIDRVKAKFDKEDQEFKKLGLNKDTRVAADNRGVESIFSVLKSMERTNFGASDRRIWSLTQTKISRSSYFLDSMPEEERQKTIWGMMRSRSAQKQTKDDRDRILQVHFENEEALLINLDAGENVENIEEVILDEELIENNIRDERLDYESSSSSDNFQDEPVIQPSIIDPSP